MKNLKTKFINKQIGILGLGEENVALIKFLAPFGCNITICDQAAREDSLAPYLNQLKGIKYKLQLGSSYLDDLEKFNIAYRTPGIPYLHPKIQEAKDHGVEISSEIKLFFELCSAMIIGVTGTKGKGTTTTLIGDILKKAVKASDTRQYINKVYVAGNIGKAPIDFVDQLTKDDIVVLELSSFMLQDLDVSPHISVVLDIKSDHLDVHASREEYVEAKTSIVKYQTKNDFAIINHDYATSLDFATQTESEVFWISRKHEVDQGVYIDNDNIILKIDGKKQILVKINEVTLRGAHNLENIGAAIVAAYAAGANVSTISSVVKKFKGLEHRLEYVAQIAGVKYYNDSFSTTPDTAIAAINSFSEPIILIAGGSEKNADYTELGKEISTKVKTVVLIGQTAPRIKEKLIGSKLKLIDNCQDLSEVMTEVKKEAKRGDVVLLSPASASFGWFKNYKDRGQQFKKLVLKEIQ